VTFLDSYSGIPKTSLGPGLSILFDLIHWFGAFPFPPVKDEPVDYLCFLRALTTLDDWSNLEAYGSLSGELGPHRGCYRTVRGRTLPDRRRMFFRSLAKPWNADGSHSELQALAGKYQEQNKDGSSCRRILIPQFEIFQHDDSLERGSEEWHDSVCEVSLGKLEDERFIDVLDVLAITCPTNDSWYPIAPPYRFAFEVVLPSLPHHELFLDELRIPHNEFVKFSKVLAFLKAQIEIEDETILKDFDIDAAASEICAAFCESGEDVTWCAFDQAVAKTVCALAVVSIKFELIRPSILSFLIVSSL
jgi:hypothetical protein